MQKVTDFLLKYKRYFGAAALLFVFVIVLVNCTGKKEDKPSDTENTTEQTTMDTQQLAEGYEVTGKLEKNALESGLVGLLRHLIHVVTPYSSILKQFLTIVRLSLRSLTGT